LLLKQGRKIDAVSLARSKERLDLTQAAQRVDGVEKRMKAGVTSTGTFSSSPVSK